MTENKRFMMCHQQNDIIGWTMSIVDWETDEPFDYTTYEVHSESITDTKDEMEDLCLLLNELNDENEQLKTFKQKVFDVINRKIDECEEDYNRAVKAGMPSNSIYDEIELLEWLKKELEE